MVKIKGDGECFFRAVGYIFLVVDFERALDWLLDFPDSLNIFSSSMNARRSEVTDFLRNWLRRVHSNNEKVWCTTLRDLWNTR